MGAAFGASPSGRPRHPRLKHISFAANLAATGVIASLAARRRVAYASRMANDVRFRMPPHERRAALRLGYVNGMLWSIGNGLTTGTLIIYLALDLGVSRKGVAIGLILAAPAAVGLLRLVSPVLIHLLGTAKATCLWFSAASYAVLWGLPAMAVPGWTPRDFPLAWLVGLLCLHQLLEYIASVAFWSWMADLAPSRVRGRYFGRRQVLQLAVLIPTLLASGMFTDWWKTTFPRVSLLGYAIPTAIGALFLWASLVPLMRMPATRRTAHSASLPVAALLRQFPFRDGRYWRLLLFGCVFSFANGLTQSAQNIYPYMLGLGVFSLAWMRTTMRAGQLGVSHWAGPFSDRFGNRPVLILCQFLVAMGPLFFAVATPTSVWLVAGAWIVWSAYAGLNICLPNLMLKLAPGKDNAAYIASYFAITNVTYAASTVLGGYIFDSIDPGDVVRIGSWVLDPLKLLFLLGWLARTVAVVFLIWIIEPGAWRWRRILQSWRR